MDPSKAHGTRAAVIIREPRPSGTPRPIGRPTCPGTHRARDCPTPVRFRLPIDANRTASRAEPMSDHSGNIVALRPRREPRSLAISGDLRIELRLVRHTGYGTVVNWAGCSTEPARPPAALRGRLSARHTASAARMTNARKPARRFQGRLSLIGGRGQKWRVALFEGATVDVALLVTAALAVALLVAVAVGLVVGGAVAIEWPVASSTSAKLRQATSMVNRAPVSRASALAACLSLAEARGSAAASC